MAIHLAQGSMVVSKLNHTASIWDRLMASGTPAAGAAASSPTLDTVKAAVARDLENLLNTRLAIVPELLAPFPACRKSILNYGLRDFAAMCLTSSEDRSLICASLKAAIERHEPRLRRVSAIVILERGATNFLDFAIAGTLTLGGIEQRIELSAVFQPSSLRYAIAPARRLHAGSAR